MLDQFRAQKLEWNRANNQIYDRVETSSGDSNGRTLFVQISNGGTVEDLTGATLSLAWNRKTEQGLESFEEVDAKKGQFRLFYPTGMLVNHGVLQASLVLVDVTGRIESKPFDIIVHKGTVDDEAVESDNKFTALTTALVKVSQVQAEFDGLYAEKSLMMDTLHDDKKADMEVLEADYSNRANTLESTYAPRLTEAESEIDMARGGATTLGERLDSEKVEVSAQLAQTAKKSDTGWATLDIYTEEERSKLLGLEPGEINAVLGAGNVVEENIGNGQVTPNKTNFFDVKNNLFDSSRLLLNKSIDSNGDIIDSSGYWTTSYKIPVTTGDRLNLTPSVYRIALYNSEGDFFSRSGTLQDGIYNVTSSVARNIAISGALDPNTVMFNKGATLLPYEPYGAVIKSEHLPDISDLYNRIEDVESSQSKFEVIKKIDYEIGAINADGTNAGGTNAYRTVIPFTMSESGKLTVSDGYRAFIVAKRQNETITSAVWLEANSVYTPTEPVTISLMVRTSSNTLPSTIGEFVKVKNETSLVTYGELSDLSTGGSGSGNVVKYVKTTGSDSADGNTFNSAYRTPQKAINEGASQIYMERADYPNSNLTMANPPETLTILPYEYASHTSIGEGRKKIRFLGGEKIIGWTAQGSIFKKNMPAGVNFSAVFIDKTLPPMTTGSRPAPNAVMWESKDYELDYMLTPVLSVAEVEENQGSFYWDGNTTYINPLDITNEFWLPKIAHGLIFDGVKNLTVSEVVADYYLSTTISAKKVNNLKLNHCESHHTAKSNGFSLDYSFGELNECKAYKNRNDGYNNHFEGHITLNNCEGINNFDDGASPHENATVTVYGGIYRGNGKGGVIPALGGTARVYNAILQDNKIGFHNATEAKGSISSGNLFIGNETGLRSDTGNNGLISVNDKFIDNTTDVIGEFTRY